MAWSAVAAVSYLAGIYDGGRTKASSAAIAGDRQISQAIVAKVLTTLSQAGIISGSPGPGGGYFLARPPEKIHLVDVVRVFDKVDSEQRCPFGPNWCGSGDPCPLHDEITRLNEESLRFLTETSFKVFRAPGPGR